MGKSLNKKIYIITSFLISIFGMPSFSQSTALNAEISSMVRPNWEFQAFWAIPRVGQTKPLVAVSVGSNGISENNIRCINLEYHALEKEFRPKVVLEREFLHKIMCKSIKKAVAKTKGLQGILFSLGVEELGLKFDFLNGWIQIHEIPQPPDPSDEIIKPIQTEHHQQNT